MNRLTTSARCLRHLKPLIECALNEGWEVTCTTEGHLRFTKSGLPAIYTGSPSTDHHASCNVLTHVQQQERTAITNQDDYNG